MTSRKDFIRTAALGGAGLLLANNAFANLVPMKKPRVIIIGAGFAGLAAALELHRRNIDFVILEARNRIGGRVFSHKVDEAENLVIELGGEWVGNSFKKMLKLCDELNLVVNDNLLETRLIRNGKFFDKGEWGFSEPWKKKFEELKKEYKKLKKRGLKTLDNIDWWRYLVNNGCDGEDLVLRELMDSTDFCEGLRHVSAYAALGEYSESNATNEMDKKIAGGNNQLAFAIRDVIGADKILLEHKVEKIEQTGKVKVTCQGGKIFEGDKIICTIPTFAAKQITWLPELPGDMRMAMNELQYGRVNKTALVYKERFWKDESWDLVTDMPGHYFYHATKNQKSKKGVLISYSIGDKAPVVSSQTDEWRADMANSSLRAGYGETDKFLEKQVTYYWGDDMYSRGSYAMYGIGQYLTIMPILRRSFKHTHFAGEHLSEAWQGFMEGAIETGQEAAAKI